MCGHVCLQYVCVCVSGERRLEIRARLCEGETCCSLLPPLQLLSVSVCVCVLCKVPALWRCDLISENETDTPLSDII